MSPVMSECFTDAAIPFEARSSENHTLSRASAVGVSGHDPCSAFGPEVASVTRHGSRLKLVRPRVDSLTCTHLRLQGRCGGRRCRRSLTGLGLRSLHPEAARANAITGWQCMHVSSRQDKPSVRRPEIEWSDPGGATNTSRGLTHSLEAPRRAAVKATRTRRPCPTCGSPIDRGPGQHAYCSDECRPICEHPTCDRPTRGMQTVCDSHRVQLDRHGELRPDTWSKEWVCVVCGQVSRRGRGAVSTARGAVSKPTLDTTGVAQRRRNVGYAGRTSPYSGAPGRGFSAPTLSGAAPAVENPPKRADI
ncbi:hypothetical protein SAMN04488548_1314 [Gordonia westfalica]|uniref:Uncharacterized protein n=1 Tax=Gordonia westfalica TaxID=158898 RepID=A0A1H2EG75_9ACTN|nr:hypothetical protein SAMN04488548_1314 [Gordonia westfalica]